MAGAPEGSAVELRVHGVGGPQGPKILGWPTGTDVVTLPPVTGDDGQPTPVDAGSRFVRPLVIEPGRPQTEAYEWGALTVASGLKALWVVFLPFTLLNVGGWARAKTHRGAGTGGDVVDRRARAVRDAGPRSLGYLGTVTYVLWLGYVLFEQVGGQWHARLIRHDGHPWYESWGLPVAVVVVFCGVLAALAVANAQSGRQFENVTPDRPLAPPAGRTSTGTGRWGRAGHLAAGGLLGAAIGRGWTDGVSAPGRLLALLGVALLVGALSLQRWRASDAHEQYDAVDTTRLPPRWNDSEDVRHPDFFAHSRSLWRLRHRHSVLAAATAGLVVWVAFADRNEVRTHLGPAIVLLANAQLLVLVLVWITSLGGKTGRGTRAALLTLGTVLCHAVFAGLALLLRERLSGIPEIDDGGELAGGPELALADQFLLALSIGVAVAVVVALVRTRPSEYARGRVVTLVRRLPLVGIAVGLAFVVCFVWLTVREATETFTTQPCEAVPIVDKPACWYDGYGFDPDNTWQDLGARVLVLLPLAVPLALRSSTTVGRVLGNVWDVLTFWPRRYHPFAVPPYGERAVPELRHRLAALADAGGVVLAGHSQGSVISFAAIGALDRQRQRQVYMLSFGSPLGTLYRKVFPMAIGDAVLDQGRDDLRHERGEKWRVFWRRTDPIGGPVFDDDPAVDQELADPPPPPQTPPTAAELARRPPLDRPPPWRVTRGHGFYPSEDAYREGVTRAVTLLQS